MVVTVWVTVTICPEFFVIVLLVAGFGVSFDT